MMMDMNSIFKKIGLCAWQQLAFIPLASNGSGHIFRILHRVAWQCQIRPASLFKTPFSTILILLILMGAMRDTKAAAELQTPTTTEVEPYDQVQKQLLEQGAKLIGEKQAAEAIKCCIDPTIAFYEGRLDKDKRTYSSRTSAETLFYMLEAASSKVNAVALNSNFGYAYYLKSFALSDLHQYEAAIIELKKAIELSPQNSQFLSERGNQLAMAREWKASLEMFRKAEDAAKITSPQETKTGELGRALRGQGYALVELNQASQAEKIYEECIRLDPGDYKAAAELRYVRSIILKGSL